MNRHTLQRVYSTMTMNVMLNTVSMKTYIFSNRTRHYSMNLSVNVVPTELYYKVQLNKSISCYCIFYIPEF